MLCFFANLREQVLTQPDRGQQQVVEFLRTRVTGEQVEQFREILPESLSTSE